jgi:DNA-binding LytR/AlgR family response regulator
MGVTLEQARCIAEDMGVADGFEACQVMRKHGVRRMNVFANTGQSKYAFNGFQASMLPRCFRPPPGTNSGSVNS